MPSGPLVSYVTRRWPDGNDVQWSRLLHIDRRRWFAYRAHGTGIRVDIADQLCAELNVHPSYLWGWDVWLDATRPPLTRAQQRTRDRERRRRKKQEASCPRTDPASLSIASG